MHYGVIADPKGTLLVCADLPNTLECAVKAGIRVNREDAVNAR